MIFSDALDLTGVYRDFSSIVFLAFDVCHVAPLPTRPGYSQSFLLSFTITLYYYP